MYTKFKLRRYLKKDGFIIINKDFPYLMKLQHLSDAKLITIGFDAAPVSYTHLDVYKRQE